VFGENSARARSAARPAGGKARATDSAGWPPALSPVSTSPADVSSFPSQSTMPSRWAGQGDSGASG